MFFSDFPFVCTNLTLNFLPILEHNLIFKKKAVNKELKSLCDGNKITTDMKKQLKQITPTTPIARPTFKAHQNPLKVRLIINTKGSSYYKIAKFVSRELKPLTTSATSFIKDSEQFVNKLKNIQLQEGEKNCQFRYSRHVPIITQARRYQGS